MGVGPTSLGISVGPSANIGSWSSSSATVGAEDMISVGPSAIIGSISSAAVGEEVTALVGFVVTGCAVVGLIVVG